MEKVKINPREPTKIMAYFYGHFPVVSKECRSFIKNELVEHTTQAEFNSVNGTFSLI